MIDSMLSDGPIRIAGAGPSGLTAAITLARAGRDVEVFERRHTVGARFGGDLQGLENWSEGGDALQELLALGIDTDDFCAAPFVEGTQTNGVRDDTFTFDAPAFYLVKRGDVPGSLDRALARQAQALGVRLRFGETCPPSSSVITATGPRGRTPFAIDAGIVFETDAADCAIALLNDSAAPRGYAYLLITNGYGCCCTMLFDDFPSIHSRLAVAKKLLIDARGIRVLHPRSVGGLGHVRASGAWTDGPSLCVGEAAGLQDLLWGFGIRLAVRSGALAARSLLAGASYTAAAERAFAPVLHRGVVNRWLWEASGGGDYTFVRAALRALTPMRILRAVHEPHWWQALLTPIASHALRSRYPGVFAEAVTTRGSRDLLIDLPTVQSF
jgi:flavin-dependent dehydrogenase